MGLAVSPVWQHYCIPTNALAEFVWQHLMSLRHLCCLCEWRSSKGASVSERRHMELVWTLKGHTCPLHDELPQNDCLSPGCNAIFQGLLVQVRKYLPHKAGNAKHTLLHQEDGARCALKCALICWRNCFGNSSHMLLAVSPRPARHTKWMPFAHLMVLCLLKICHFSAGATRRFLCHSSKHSDRLLKC